MQLVIFQATGVSKMLNSASDSEKPAAKRIISFNTALVVYPFKSSAVIQSNFSTKFGINVSSRTVRRRLSEKKLRGCIVQHKPLVSKNNLFYQISFARKHLEKPMFFWKNVLWSDESKFCKFRYDGAQYVWRHTNMLYNSKYLSKTVKHGGENVVVFVAFSEHYVGHILKIGSRMNQYVYKIIIVNTMIPYADEIIPP